MGDSADVPLGGRSAAEGGTDQQGESAPHGTNCALARPRRGVRLLLVTSGTCPVLRPRPCGRRNGPYIHLTYISLEPENGGIGQSHSMSAKPQQLGSPNVGTPPSTIPIGLRVLAMALRAVFIGALVVVTVRVSSPQSETFSSVYETPGDLIRLALGFGVCLWIVIHLFMLPKDAEGYRTWVYLGLVVAPLALAVAFVLW